MRCLEFYSGVGGWRYAIQATDTPYEIVAAFDVSTSANSVYNHNHRRPTSTTTSTTGKNKSKGKGKPKPVAQQRPFKERVTAIKVAIEAADAKPKLPYEEYVFLDDFRRATGWEHDMSLYDESARPIRSSPHWRPRHCHWHWQRQDRESRPDEASDPDSDF